MGVDRQVTQRTGRRVRDGVGGPVLRAGNGSRHLLQNGTSTLWLELYKVSVWLCGWWVLGVVVGGGGGEAPVAGGAGGLHLMSQKNGLIKQGIE